MKKEWGKLEKKVTIRMKDFQNKSKRKKKKIKIKNVKKVTMWIHKMNNWTKKIRKRKSTDENEKK